MINPLRSLMFVFARSGLALGLFLTGCHDPTVDITASPGETPGFDANPFNPSGPPTLGSVTLSPTITVKSVNKFAGPVTLSAECCHEVIRDRWLPLDPAIYFLPSFSPNPLNIPSSGSASATMNISVQAGNFTQAISPTALFTGIPYSKYLVKVVAKDQGGGLLATTNVGVKVLPRLEPGLGCRPNTLQRSLLAPVVAGQITDAEATPRKTPTVIAMYKTPGSPGGYNTAWKIEIFDDPVRPAWSAEVTLKNNSTNLIPQQKEISSKGCPGSGEFVRAQPGQTSVKMLLDQSQDNTLVFAQEECFGICWWIDVAVFAEPAFWSVFGGKKVTITWIGQ